MGQVVMDKLENMQNLIMTYESQFENFKQYMQNI